MKYYVVDRISSSFIYLEDEEGLIIKLKKNFFANDIKEGDIVYKNNENMFLIDVEKTVEEKSKIEKDFFDLFT